MTVGSLFAGIGGFDLGFERAGFEIRWQVEVDRYALRVLETHWPHVRRYGDICGIDWRDVEPVDVLCGGFPCQPHSTAGRRLGAADERDLWSEFARAIRGLRPRWVVAENVPGLLSTESGRFFGRILRDLATCGYDAEWDCLPAVAFGAPHRRDRVWLIAYPQPDRTGRSAQSLQEHDERGISGWAKVSADVNGRRDARTLAHAGCERDATRGEAGHVAGAARATQSDSAEREWLRHAAGDGCAVVADTDSGNRYGRGGNVQMGRIWSEGETPDYLRAGGTQWCIEPDVGRVAHGVPHRVDRLRGLGNAIVPQIAEWLARRILEAEERLT